MDKVRIGISGLGNMGASHAATLLAGKVRRAQLCAVCDMSESRLAQYPQLHTFKTSEELIRSGTVDAVIIATPHFSHTPIGIDALEHGLHVLVEKPISVHKADCERLIAAHKDPSLVFAAMFQMRTSPHYLKLRQLVQKGELGEVHRVTWTNTDWFRSEAYYASGSWRGTWAGEGGGVLLNQAPHQLDLFQWIFGMPSRVRAFCHLGRYHDIEVEDDVTAYFEFPNGAVGVFMTSTGEAPGTSRLDISAERGRVIWENGQISYTRNEVPTTQFSQTTTEGFAPPPTWNVQIPVEGATAQHAQIIENFVDAILDGTPLIAPAEQGMNSIELANAMLFSSLRGQTIEFPLDSAAYEQCLKQLIANSRFVKKQEKVLTGDFTKSFHR